MENELQPGLFDSLLPDRDIFLDEAALLDIFTSRVEEMMRDDLDLLLSSLYRLDVEEYKIQLALRSATVPPARGIAALIINRQKERIKTKQAYRKKDSTEKDSTDWEGL